MGLLSKFAVACGLVAMLASASACKEDSASPKKGGNSDAVPTATPVATATPTASSDDCVKETTSSTATSDDDFDLAATSAPNWNDDVKDIIEGKCTQCHSVGGTSPDLSTYSLVKSKASSVWSKINDGSMPPDGETQLTSAEKTTVKNWVNGGKLQSASSASDSKTDTSTDCGDSGSKSDDVDDKKDDDSADDGEYVDGWDDFLNPKKLQECKDNGFIFDRSAAICHKAKIASWSCTQDGIIKAFGAIPISINVSSELAKFESEGYEIDQCGEYNKEPIVLFYKKDSTTEGELNLKLRKICKKGSAACEAT